MKKIAPIVVIAVAVLVSIFAVWKLNPLTPTPANVEWEKLEWIKYENKQTGLGIIYPSTFTIYERAIPKDNYHESAIDDPATQERYFFTRSYGRQSDIESASDYFVGPYPRLIAPSGNLPEQTVIERTFNGMKGIEVYGRGAEGRGYEDQFFYIAYGRLWVIALNPVIEGHSMPDNIEPTESYKNAYGFLWQSMSISPTSVVEEGTALAQLRGNMQNVTPRFIVPSWEKGQTLTAEEKIIEADVATLLTTQDAAAYPDNPIRTVMPGNDFWLNAIGKRYILLSRAGAEKSSEAILDSQTGQMTPIIKKLALYLAPDTNTALYIDSQALYTYSLDQALATLVSGSQLSGTETYHNGYIGGMGIEINPEETHTKNSITISIFDSSKSVPHPDVPRATMYAKVGQKTLTF